MLEFVEILFRSQIHLHCLEINVNIENHKIKTHLSSITLSELISMAVHAKNA